MHKDDSVLYTGMSSQNSIVIREKREKMKEEKERKRGALLPAAQLLSLEVDKERQTIASELANIIHIEMSTANIKATIMGLRLADQRIAALGRRLNNVLRVEQKNEDSDEANV